MAANQKPTIIIKKKSGGGHGGHHGGAWKVAYADFVTAMMAFFLVMWILGLSDQSRKVISSYFRNPGLFEHELTKGSPIQPIVENPVPLEDRDLCDDSIPGGCVEGGRPTPTERAAEQLERRLARLAKEHPELPELPDAVSVEVTPEGLRIEMKDTDRLSFFSVGGARPSKVAVQVLESLARELSRLPNRVELEGHTDSRPYVGGGSYSNWELSADRANAARRILVENGIEEKRVNRVAGVADRRLRNPDDPYDVSNRRVSILVIGK